MLSFSSVCTYFIDLVPLHSAIEPKMEGTKKLCCLNNPRIFVIGLIRYIIFLGSGFVNKTFQQFHQNREKNIYFMVDSSRKIYFREKNVVLKNCL